MAVVFVPSIEQTIRFGKGLVDAAKSVEIDESKFLNLDISQSVIRYKRMAPIVIARRLKATFQLNESENQKLPAFIAEFEAAQEFNITEGKAELIQWTATQSDGRIQVCLGVYNLYSFKDKPVCDFIMLDIAQKTTVDKSRLMCKYGAAGLTLSLFVPFIGPVLAGAALLLGALNVRDKSKNFTTKEEAEIGLLKTLEHYGLIRLLSNDQIELVS